MELSEEVMKEIERISHERIQEINGNLDEALKYLTELKYPVAPKKFDPTGTINQYHEAKRQGAVFGIKIALTSPELLSKAGYVKKEQSVTIESLMSDLIDKRLITICNVEETFLHLSAKHTAEFLLDKYQITPLPSPPQNK